MNMAEELSNLQLPNPSPSQIADWLRLHSGHFYWGDTELRFSSSRASLLLWWVLVQPGFRSTEKNIAFSCFRERIKEETGYLWPQTRNAPPASLLAVYGYEYAHIFFAIWWWWSLRSTRRRRRRNATQHAPYSSPSSTPITTTTRLSH